MDETTSSDDPSHDRQPNSAFPSGGLLRPGVAAYRAAVMRKPDTVLTEQQWRDIERPARGGS